MLQLLLHIILISAVCIAWGLPALVLLKTDLEESITHRLITLFFWGLITLALFSSWAVLFVPLQFQFLLIATSVLVAVVFLVARNNPALKQLLQVRRGQHVDYIVILFACSCILLFLLLGSLKPSNFDTDIYHLQLIRWSNEYGVVPGIANLYPRFGLGSNWFHLISLFHIPGLHHQNFTFLNVTVAAWFLCWLLHKWKTHSVSPGNKIDTGFAAYYFLLIVYFLFDWQLFRDAANSTSYDFVVTALTLMAISWLAENTFLRKSDQFSIGFVVLAFSIIPFKFSGIFIVALVFFYLVQLKNKSAWIKTALAAMVIIIPALLRNYYTSGYPLFPATITIGSPDWQLPVEMTRNLNAYIMNGNKFYNYPTSFMHEQDITLFNWIPFWIKHVLLRHKVILVLALLSSLLFFYNPVKEVSHIKTRLLLAGAWLMLAGWFMTAPDPRFAFSIILFLAFFPVCLVFGHLVASRIYQFAFTVAIIPIVIYAGMKVKEHYSPDLALYPASITIPAFKPETRNGVTIHNTRINDEWMCPCYFAPLPCIGENNPFVIPRKDRIKDGFYMNPKPDSSFIKSYNY